MIASIASSNEHSSSDDELPTVRSEGGAIPIKIRVVGEHPRAREAMRILARLLVRVARQNELDNRSSLSAHVERGADAATEKCA